MLYEDANIDNFVYYGKTLRGFIELGIVAFDTQILLTVNQKRFKQT